MWHNAVLFAQTNTGGGSSSSGWKDIIDSYGFPLALVLLIMLGRFVPGFIYDQVRKDRDDARGEVQKMTETTMEKVVPALVESNRLVRESMDILAAIRADREQERRRPSTKRS